MADIGLIKLLKDKYNTPIDGEDCITFHHMQLVINTVKEQQQAEIDELKVLLEAKDHVIDCAIDLAEKTEVEGFYATSDVYVDFRDALKPFMPDVKALGYDADIEMFGYGTEDLGDLGDK